MVNHEVMFDVVKSRKPTRHCGCKTGLILPRSKPLSQRKPGAADGKSSMFISRNLPCADKFLHCISQLYGFSQTSEQEMCHRVASSVQASHANEHP